MAASQMSTSAVIDLNANISNWGYTDLVSAASIIQLPREIRERTVRLRHCLAPERPGQTLPLFGYSFACAL